MLKAAIWSTQAGMYELSMFIAPVEEVLSKHD